MPTFCTWNIVTMERVVQHRKYYGMSGRNRNKKNFSFHSNVTDDNLRFLHPEQVLADTAHFINHIQATVPGASRSPFILVGGHYSASLAVWFRQSYPHLALGIRHTPTLKDDDN